MLTDSLYDNSVPINFPMSGDFVMNSTLVRIHCVLIFCYLLAFTVLSIVINDSPSITGSPESFQWIGLACLFGLPLLIHSFCVIGARRGKQWGRILSKVIGTIMLLGFPIGTVFGYLILAQTGKKWKAEPQGELAVS